MGSAMRNLVGATEHQTHYRPPVETLQVSSCVPGLAQAPSASGGPAEPLALG